MRDSELLLESTSAQRVQDVGSAQALIHRVERIEKHLGLSIEDLDDTSHPSNSTTPVGLNRSMAPVLAATVQLKTKAAGAPNANAWDTGIVEHLWKSYDSVKSKADFAC